jgi:hypothetical protein
MASVQEKKLQASELLAMSDAEFERTRREAIPPGHHGLTIIDLRSLSELPQEDREKVKQRIQYVKHFVQEHPMNDY